MAFVLHEVYECPSTHLLLADRLVHAPHVDHAVRATQQSAGQGRGDNHWESPPGGLYLSAFIRNSQELLPFRLALAARDTAPALDFKWPNDLLVDERKAGGILVVVRDGWTMAGIGLNTDHSKGLPGAYGRVAGAPADLARSFLHHLERRLTEPGERVLVEYRTHLTTIGQRVEVWDGPRQVDGGLATDIAADGALVLDQQRAIHSGSIRVVAA